MYDKRVKIFIAISLAMLLVYVLRLVQMQLIPHSNLQDEITRLKEQSGTSRLLKTVRGKILDRDGNVLAADAPRFQVCINYQLTSCFDDRVVEAARLKAAENDPNPSLVRFYNEVEARRSQINEIIIPGCLRLGMNEAEIRSRIEVINDYMWNQRAFQAWRRSDPDPKLLENILSVKLSEAMADFARRVPDPNERQRRIADVDDLRELQKPMPLFELKTDDDISAAQIEFMDVNDVQILPTGYRQYPYSSVAAQTIGWVGLATQKRDKELFEDNRLARYLEGDFCGREDGVEYVCESILRGHRGELVYDIDRKPVRETDPDYGDDVILTLDAALQKRIEQVVTNPQISSLDHDANRAAGVIDARSGDSLALAPLPTYDLNTARYKYGDILKDSSRPAIHRAINRQYLPGSSIKPIILIAAMEAGLVTAEEEIECPSHDAPQGWPNCLIWRSSRVGHSSQWTNNARNALKGSCNIYFSRLADRFDPPVLQRWLFRFGYGRPLPLACPVPLPGDQEAREMRQSPGQISTERPKVRRVQSFDDIPPMRRSDKANFGIGHGNLWATPLQVANAFATIARDGLHKPPRLFLQPHGAGAGGPDMSADLGISAHTLAVVRDGMSAVVNERGGSAYSAFAGAGLSRYGVQVYGKTGSTERPDDAWFGGFAEDTRGRKIALAVVVEGGQSGSHDAAPLARHIIQLCIQAGHIGNGALTPPVTAAGGGSNR